MKKSYFRYRIAQTGLLLIMGFFFISFINLEKTTLPLLNNNQLSAQNDVIESSVTNVTFYSKSLKEERNVQVYLPEGYDIKSNKQYPVIYFLHATAQNSYSEESLFAIFDKLIKNKTISPVIIVKPDGNGPVWGFSYFSNSALNGNYEDYIVKDLVEFIDSTYHTIALRHKRAIMGWSAGGSCAMRTALKHPDIFCAVASHSGRLDMSTHSLYIPGILSENGGTPVSSFKPDAGPISLGIFTMARVFSPNPDNPPYFVDFPIDSIGNFIDSVWNRWLSNDCSFLAGKISKNDDLAIYFDCGRQDETMAYPFNTSFADSLDKLGLPCKFESFDGGHYDRYSRYPVGLAFLDSVMNSRNTERDSWTFKNPMPTGRGFTSGAVVDEKIFIIGGFPNHNSLTAANEMYDPATNSWTVMSEMPEDHFSLAAAIFHRIAFSASSPV